MTSSLTKLRNRKTGIVAFRAAARLVCFSLARSMAKFLAKRGVPQDEIVLVIVLRSGIALLEPALRVFPDVRVGVVGLKRDEHTFVPHWYYENVPKLTKRSTVVILDPMLATGGSAEAVVKRLLKRGAEAKNIFFLGVIAAPEGIARLARHISREHIVLAAVDEGLTSKKLITPGLGDFGDRYFGFVR